MFSTLKRKNSDEKHPYRSFYSSGSYNFKNFFFSGTLLAVLIWGSSLLLHEINVFEVGLASSAINRVRTARPAPDFHGKLPLNFSAVRDGVFSPKFKDLQWIHEPESISNDKGTYVLKVEENNSVEYVIKSIVDEDYQYTLYNQSSFEHEHIHYDIVSLVASPNLKQAILKTNSTQHWRHSSFALYWVLDVESHAITPLLDTNSKVSVTSWSPESTDIAFIYENNVYLKNTKSNKVTQVSFDGGREFFNGKPDWVYEEEVFSTDIALWWSPDGKKVTFLKSNDTEVPEFTIPYYVQHDEDDYPELVNIKYPKPGYPNPIVDIVVYDLSTETDQLLQLKSDKIESDQRLITEVTWVGDSLLVRTSNRASDLLEIFLLDTTDNSIELVRSHTAKKSWFEITKSVYIPKDEAAGRKDDGYIDIVVEDGYNHLAYFSPPSSKEGKLLTKGLWEVVSVESFDYNKNELYFKSTIKSSIERHLHSVNILDQGLPEIKDITVAEGVYAGSFSSGSRYLLLTYEGPNVPYQELIDLYESKTIKTLEANKALSENLEKYVIPENKYQVVSLVDEETGNKIKANAIETFPLNFDPKRKYPVLFFVYGGPGSQLVSKSFSVGFSSVVAAELDAVVVTVDGRGTGFNNLNPELGADYKFTVRDRLGHYEPLDQIAAAKHWGQRDYVDSDNIAIWGWSYGGFLTLKTLETDHAERVFSYGLAIAPVTKWKLYDSVYTERYLRTPQENPEGYRTASISNATNLLSVKKFFIGHGSGDDNVHVQQSLKLIDELNLASVENFDFMIFPDSDHSIRYHNGNKIVYDRILDFFRKAFRGEFN
ncbi:dipeptidyl aminopeptidase B [Suhomyces tanzawaensis NRRL Y-17324]|uniref:Dipeptidyl aminopeptidase B n=1 Tax=Suhomyces tanzawaensis NRRL Y-17324 TaxID=984487 RepID=A0A1E4SFB3_9ASCO|nr:dipeptidyl aminopeptidase B [Suhomyces tanzawaensis NRRL Y-17324]ODV78188.1 dipeptidyl aminopeptidase B [Suhomyces tanzawaensis NRRL Y-17324]